MEAKPFIIEVCSVGIFSHSSPLRSFKNSRQHLVWVAEAQVVDSLHELKCPLSKMLKKKLMPVSENRI